MTTEGTTFSTPISEQDVGNKAFIKPDSLRRFRHFIEHSEWDEVMLTHDEWIEKMCIVIIIVTALSFIPTVLAMLFLR